MALAKEERQKLEHQVHQLKHDGGSRAVLELLKLDLEDLNKKWFTLQGDDLIKAQGEAKHITKLIGTIEDGPKIKPKE